jgi:hypothetical protein
MSKDTPKKAESIVDVQQVYTKTEMFLENNRKGISIVLGALVLIFGGFFAYQYLYKNPKEAEASNAAIRADLWAEMDSLEWAVKGKDEFEGFEALAEKYGSTKVVKERTSGVVFTIEIKLLTMQPLWNTSNKRISKMKPLVLKRSVV